MDVQDVVDWAVKADENLEYPSKPEKPVKRNGETNADFGERLDAYEGDMATWKKYLNDYRQARAAIDAGFKERLLSALGIADNPKAGKLFDMAWEEGHSSGYNEVAFKAEELAELLK